jgi:hypothetical protein
MTFLQEFEAELVKKLQSTEDPAAIVHWAGGQVLKSYKNGITAGRKGTTVIRKGKSRRRPLPAQSL